MMSLKVLSVLLCIAFASGKSVRNGQSPVIVGGDPAEEGEIPYQVSLRSVGDDWHFCGGFIIDAEWVMTAAHCVDDGALVDILAGQVNLGQDSDSSQTITAKNIYIHPNYTRSANSRLDPYIDGDIAVIELSSALKLGDNVQPITLPPPGYLASSEVLVSGWGSTGKSGIGAGAKVDQLQKVVLPFVTDEDCNDAYNGDGYAIPDSQLCAGDLQNGGIDSCQGDSGGPLVEVSSGYVVAIVSWGRGCALPGYPGVNTEISYFLGEWVNEIMSAHKK